MSPSRAVPAAPAASCFGVAFDRCCVCEVLIRVSDRVSVCVSVCGCGCVCVCVCVIGM